MPLANIFTQTNKRVHTFPLILSQCSVCGLVQLGDIVKPGDIFPRYGYVSGASEPLIEHLTDLARDSITRFKLNRKSSVLDVGANDGTFLTALGSRVGLRVGIDPARAVSKLISDQAVHMVPSFFNERTAALLVRKFRRFDLIVSTHTLANIVDFGEYFHGIDTALSPDGTLILEVGLSDTVIGKGYFDSIYHEHYAYFSRETLAYLLALYGFVITRATRLPYQGGSLLVYARRRTAGKGTAIRIKKPRMVHNFGKFIEDYKSTMAHMMKKYSGKTVIGFGVPAKAVTLVHVCGLSPYISAFVDSTKMKQGYIFPGTHARIYPESYISGRHIDAIILFSWNYAPSIIPKIKTLLNGHIDIIIPFPKPKIISI